MTEKEKEMYGLLSCLSEAKAPIIFKGGLITNLVLQEKNYKAFHRATVDIDANWVDTPPSMKELVDVIKKSLDNFEQPYTILPFREYGNGKSAGLNFFNENQEKLFSMDIDIKPIIGSRNYYYGNAVIQGVLPTEIIADKLLSVSSDSVYKHRTKDLVDLYALANCIDVKLKNIYEICESKNRELNGFDGFLDKKDLIQHAYDKLKRIEDKPFFNDVYEYVKTFAEPFIFKDKNNQIWLSQKSQWEEEKSLTINKNAKSNMQKKSYEYGD